MEKSNNQKNKDWSKDFFQEFYLKAWESKQVSITKEKTNKQVNFLIDVLKLKKKDKILDLCCGQGRHSIELRKKGFDIIGVDYSDYLLRVARNRARKRNVKVAFIKQDARDLKLEDKFDVVLNLFTAFGYYEDDKENERIIKSVSDNLSKSGKFLIDISNSTWILKNYKPEMWEETDLGIMRVQNEFSVKKFGNYSRYTFYLKNGKRKFYDGYVRMYTFPEIKSLLEKHGLKVMRVWGSFDKEEFDDKASRMIVMAKKLN